MPLPTDPPAGPPPWGGARVGGGGLPTPARHIGAAADLVKLIKDAGGRVELYDQNEPMRVKIAKAQSQKIPYMVILGDAEVAEQTISVRDRIEGDLGTCDRRGVVDKIRDAAL